MASSTDLNRKLKALVKEGNAGGCLSPAQYWESHPRLLWLLKETNRLPPGDSLYDYFKKCKREFEKDDFTPLWRRVGACSYGILTGKADFSETYHSPRGESKAYKGLCRVAVTNAKKQPGISGEVSIGPIRRWLNRHPQVLADELRILQPDLVLCGANWGLIRKWAEGHLKISTKLAVRRHPDFQVFYALPSEVKTHLGYQPKKPLAFFGTYHPSSRGDHRSHYNFTVNGALWALKQSIRM